MSSGQNNSTVQNFRHRYSPALNTQAVNLALVDLTGFDTIVIDDTGNVVGATIVTLPKMGTGLAPCGIRVTTRKASSVAQAFTITPTAPDLVSSTVGAYPSAAATNVLAHPAMLQSSATWEAMSLNIAGGLENPSVGPLVGGIWMCVGSSTVGI